MLIKIRNVQFSDISIIQGATWVREGCWLSCVGFSKNETETSVVALTLDLVNGWKVTWFVIHTMTLYSAKAMFNCLRSDNGRSLLTDFHFRMRTASERHAATILSQENNVWINQSITSILKSTSKVKLSTMSDQTLTGKLPIRTKKRIVSKSCIGSSIALRSFRSG